MDTILYCSKPPGSLTIFQMDPEDEDVSRETFSVSLLRDMRKNTVKLLVVSTVILCFIVGVLFALSCITIGTRELRSFIDLRTFSGHLFMPLVSSNPRGSV